MAYAIKRSYGTRGQNHDYLHAWCDQYGTACMGSIKMALIFATKELADAAAEKAQQVCKGANGLPAKGFTFTAVPFNGLCTQEFLSSVTEETRAAILKNIAVHYDKTPEVILEAITDADAEHLLEYMREPLRSDTSALMMRHGMRGW